MSEQIDEGVDGWIVCLCVPLLADCRGWSGSYTRAHKVPAA